MYAIPAPHRGTPWIALLVLALLTGPAYAQDIVYQAVQLGTLGGGSGDSEGWAINDYGQIVGRSHSSAGEPHMFHWENYEMLDLNIELQWDRRIQQLIYGVGFDISNTDLIAGATQCSPMCPPDELDSDVPGGKYVHACLFRPAVMSDLGTPYPGDGLTILGTLGSGLYSAATGVSPGGLYVVGWSDTNTYGSFHGFLVTPVNGEWSDRCVICDDPANTLLKDLGTLRTPDEVSSATAVNDAGQVVGWSYTEFPGDTAKSGYSAFLIEFPGDTNADGVLDQWSVDANSDGANDLMIDLGTLGGHNSWARDINSDAIVVGESDVGDWMTQAFLWHPDTRTMLPLGTLGGENSSACAVNNVGQVVGWAMNADDDKRAFIVNPQDTDGNGLPDRWFVDEDNDGVNDLMTDLNSLLPSGFGVRLTEARGINDSGQITGWGTIGAGDNVQRMAVLLMPVPASGAGGGGGSTGVRQDAVLEPIEADVNGGGDDDNTVDTSDGTSAPLTFGPLHFLCGMGLNSMVPLALAGLCGLKLGFGRPRRRLR
ncbi:MAG: DUF3466 family protein [Phycisphaerae bacterium]|jgi:probable HAF family extracellular repeat protein